MITFPNCKINLGLHILHKRTDGYHAIETVFYPVNLKDGLEVLEAPEGSEKNDITFSGFELDAKEEDNLCMKACRLLQNDFKQLPYVRIHLLKIIPVGAGLGGGSADGAFVLMLLNKKYNLQIPPATLENYALRLGSDVPFFIHNQPCIASGRGEIMDNIELNLRAYQIVLVNPGIVVSTAEAFKSVTPGGIPGSLQHHVLLPVEQWKDLVVNDFEKVIFEKHPEIKDIKQHLYASGALYASLSGSGSTVFGLFPKTLKLKLIFPMNYSVHYA